MNTQAKPKAYSLKPTKPVNRWHRTIGVTVAVILIYLLATGIPLQFTDQLKLAASHVARQGLLDWYGLEAPRGVTVNGRISYLDGMLFDDGVYIAASKRLVGAVRFGETRLAADTEAVWLIDFDGNRLNEATTIGDIDRIGTRSAGAVIETAGSYLVADADFSNWLPLTGEPGEIVWADVEQASPTQEAETRNLFLQRMLTWERVLQDLHSGRFFGIVGILIVDIATILLLILAGTGLVIWWRTRSQPYN